MTTKQLLIAFSTLVLCAAIIGGVAIKHRSVYSDGYEKGYTDAKDSFYKFMMETFKKMDHCNDGDSIFRILGVNEDLGTLGGYEIKCGGKVEKI